MGKYITYDNDGVVPDLPKYNVCMFGPIAMHNVVCPVCFDRHAILDFERGFQPCEPCQEKGMAVVNVNKNHRLCMILSIVCITLGVALGAGISTLILKG